MGRAGAAVAVVGSALGLAGCGGATAEEALCGGEARGGGFVGGGGKLTVAVLDGTPAEVSRAALDGLGAWGAFDEVRWRYARRGEAHDPDAMYVGTCPGDGGDAQFAFARRDTGVAFVEGDLAAMPQEPERLLLIATHEVGHLLGLEHEDCDAPESVMCEGGEPRPPSPGDLEKARLIARVVGRP